MSQSHGKKHPPRCCIFCGGTPVSKEHLFAKWMHPYLPESIDIWPEGKRHRLTLTRTVGGQEFVGPIIKGKFYSPGKIRSKKLRIACEPCNNGWMSRLQTTAKPILLPFILGEWTTLTPTSQRILAAWITMYTMVVEKSDERVETITSAERRAFKDLEEKRVPPGNWRIWIFSHEDERNPSSWWIKTLAPNDPGAIEIKDMKFGACITLFTLNKLGVLVISTVDSSVYAGAESDIRKLVASVGGLRLLWPISPFGPPKKPIGALAMAGAADFMKSAGMILQRELNRHRHT